MIAMPNMQDEFSIVEMSMADAIAALQAIGIDFDTPSPFQLKVGDLNFYPNRGTICRDGDRARLKAKGLKAFLDLVRRDPDTQRPEPENTVIHLGDALRTRAPARLHPQG